MRNVRILSLAGGRDTHDRIVDSAKAMSTICCAVFVDPRSFFKRREGWSPQPLSTPLNDTQEFSCIVTPRAESGNTTLKIGSHVDCNLAQFGVNYQLNIRTKNAKCVSAVEACKTSIILKVTTNSSDVSEYFLADTLTDITVDMFKRLELHYQICDGDVLEFRLPVSGLYKLSLQL